MMQIAQSIIPNEHRRFAMYGARQEQCKVSIINKVLLLQELTQNEDGREPLDGHAFVTLLTFITSGTHLSNGKCDVNTM